MNQRILSTLAAVTLAAAAHLPAAAEGIASSAASTASSAGSTVSGSVSDSLQGSSNSSTGGDRVAEGVYRVIEVAEVADRPGHVALHLQPTAGLRTPTGQPAADLWLRLPRAALGDQPLVAGDEVQTRLRAYGIAFARAQNAAEPFFLALADGWEGELNNRVVKM
jgi:hypothetical protein